MELPDSAVPKADGQAESVRARLKECQAADASPGPILRRAKLEELDPKRAESRKGDPRVNRLITDQYRLAPTDGVLEYKVVLTTAVIWVPVIPEGEWRYWVFCWAHGCHRTANETFQILRRAAYWPGIQTASDKFVRDCPVCLSVPLPATPTALS